MEAQRLQLEKRIDDAFADVTQPKLPNLFACPMHGPSRKCEECSELREFFGKKVREILMQSEAQKCLYYVSSLALFTPEGFQYFLPLYLKLSLLSQENASRINLVFHFQRPPNTASQMNYSIERIRPLKRVQKEVVRDTLYFLRDNYGILEEDIEDAIGFLFDPLNSISCT